MESVKNRLQKKDNNKIIRVMVILIKNKIFNRGLRNHLSCNLQNSKELQDCVVYFLWQNLVSSAYDAN